VEIPKASVQRLRYRICPTAVSVAVIASRFASLVHCRPMLTDELSSIVHDARIVANVRRSVHPRL